MNKKNKKGFTLIEMLVVIAIIAVLVAIIIPTVSNATTKAKAAADAANLRAVMAEASIDYLGGKEDTTGMLSYFPDKTGLEQFKFNTGAPVKSKLDPSLGLYVEYNKDEGKMHVEYTDQNVWRDIAYFADIAETGKVPTK